MREREREARRLRLLLARLKNDWETVTSVNLRLRVAVDRVRSSGPDPVAIAAAALYLQNLYSAVEELLRRVAADLDGSVPAGEDWHRELLGQMVLDVPGVRPRLIDPALQSDLDLLRRFRHVVRHAYAQDYDWGEMQPVLEATERVMATFPTGFADVQHTIGTAILECERD